MCPPAPRRWPQQKGFHLYVPQNFCTVKHMASVNTLSRMQSLTTSFHLPSGLHTTIFIFAYIYTFFINMVLFIPTEWLYQLNSHSFHHSTIYTTSTYLIPSHCSHPSILAPHMPFTTSSDSLHLLLCSYRFLIHISMSAEEYYSLNLSTFTNVFSHFHDSQKILQHTYLSQPFLLPLHPSQVSLPQILYHLLHFLFSNNLLQPLIYL